MNTRLQSVLLLVHYWFPVLLGLSLAVLVHRATGYAFSSVGILVLACGICAAYSFDRLVDGARAVHPTWLNRTLASAVAASTLLGLVAATRLPLQTTFGLLLCGIASVFYWRLKRFALAKTVLVAFVWVWSCMTLAVVGDPSRDWKRFDIAIPLFLLIAAGCILCDLKDVESDRRDGVGSLPARFGVGLATAVVALLAVSSMLLGWTEGRPGIIASSLLLLVLARYPAFLAKKPIGPIVVDAVLALPGFLIFLHLI